MQRINLYLGIALLLVACQPSDLENSSSDRLFEQLPPSSTGVDFSNDLTSHPDMNIIEYLYYYNGGGVGIADINNDGLEDIFFAGNEVSDRLYLNKGDFKFEDITESAGIIQDSTWSTGVTFADVNMDGYEDIYVSAVGNYKTLSGKNRLYLNNGDSSFKEVSAEVGLDFKGFGTQASFFDYDNDGDLDVYLLNHTIHTPRNYGKIDRRQERDDLSGDRLYKNKLADTGVLSFEEVTEEAGIYSSALGYGLALATADLNSDGFIAAIRSVSADGKADAKEAVGVFQWMNNNANLDTSFMSAYEVDIDGVTYNLQDAYTLLKGYKHLASCK